MCVCVYMLRTSDEQQAGGQLLQEDHTLAAVAARQKDEDGTCLDAGAELGCLGGEAACERELLVISGVPLGGRLHCGRVKR